MQLMIDKAMTLEPHGLNRGDDYCNPYPDYFRFPVFVLYVISASPF